MDKRAITRQMLEEVRIVDALHDCRTAQAFVTQSGHRLMAGFLYSVSAGVPLANQCCSSEPAHGRDGAEEILSSI